MVNLWQSGRDGMQGAFLQPIAGLWAKKATQQTARDRLITEHRELFRGSLSLRRGLPCTKNSCSNPYHGAAGPDGGLQVAAHTHRQGVKPGQIQLGFHLVK